jgi:predicted DNA-binding transcriptional regulator YafY
MKFTILLEILFELLAKRKVTAPYLAEKYEISPRSVYRYIDTLSLSVPIYVKRGRDGGICISDSYKLPKGFMTKEEYEAAIEALETMYAQLPESRFLEAKHKLSAQVKSERRELALSGEVGAFLIDGGTWGDSQAFSEKLRILEDAVKNCAIMEIEYQSRIGEKSKRKIEPHVLVFKQNVWYLFAFCYNQRAFRLFRVGRIFSMLKTEENFSRRTFKREDIPLTFWTEESEEISVRLEVEKSAFADAQDWLGGENLKKIGEKWIADLALPNDDGLVKKILSFGSGIRVIAPLSLKEKIAKTAEEIANSYRL